MKDTVGQGVLLSTSQREVLFTATIGAMLQLQPCGWSGKLQSTALTLAQVRGGLQQWGVAWVAGSCGLARLSLPCGAGIAARGSGLEEQGWVSPQARATPPPPPALPPFMQALLQHASNPASLAIKFFGNLSGENPQRRGVLRVLLAAVLSTVPVSQPLSLLAVVGEPMAGGAAEVAAAGSLQLPPRRRGLQGTGCWTAASPPALVGLLTPSCRLPPRLPCRCPTGLWRWPTRGASPSLWTPYLFQDGEGQRSEAALRATMGSDAPPPLDDAARAFFKSLVGSRLERAGVRVGGGVGAQTGR